jgi:hypothetical protein
MAAAELRDVYTAPIKPRARRPEYLTTTWITSKQGGNYLKRAAPGLTRKGHALLALHWAERKTRATALWARIADSEARRLWGRDLAIGDHRISGIASDDFSERAKNRLRRLNRFAFLALTYYRAHASAAGVTADCFLC